MSLLSTLETEPTLLCKLDESSKLMLQSLDSSEMPEISSTKEFVLLELRESCRWTWAIRVIESFLVFSSEVNVCRLRKPAALRVLELLLLLVARRFMPAYIFCMISSMQICSQATFRFTGRSYLLISWASTLDSVTTARWSMN